MTISLQKAVIIKQKYLLGWLFVFLQPLCLVFQGQWILLFFFTYLFFIEQLVLMCKKKNNDNLLYFWIYPEFSFHKLSNCMLNIRDSSIKKRCSPTKVYTNKSRYIENRSSGPATRQQKNNRHNWWWITERDIKLKGKTDNISLKIMSVLSSGLWCHFLIKSRNLQVTEVENIFNTDNFVRGRGKLNKTENECEKKLFVPYCLQKMNATGKWQRSLDNLSDGPVWCPPCVLSLWSLPRPLHHS